MTEELKEKPAKSSSAWSVEEKKLIGTYGCQLIYEDATQEQLVDRNCLLYTSPSPRDRTRSRMPSSA